VIDNTLKSAAAQGSDGSPDQVIAKR
jgi:hypothetical protein